MASPLRSPWVHRALLLLIPLVGGLALEAERRPPASGSSAEGASSSVPAKSSAAVVLLLPPHASATGPAPEGPATAALDDLPPPNQPLLEEPRRTRRAPRRLVAAVDLPAVTDSHAPRGEPRSAGAEPWRGACGGVEVKVITSSADPAWSFATLLPAPGGPPLLARVGDAVAGRTVTAIEWDRVVLGGASGPCAVVLESAARAGRGEEGARGPGPWSLPEELAGSIEKRAEHEFSIGRAALRELMGLGERLFAGLRLEPEGEASQASLRFRAIPEGSLLDRLELAEGDRLLTLDGAAPTEPQDTVRRLAELGSRGRLAARLEREGETYELSLMVR